jgi:Tol biopolymer transport system component/serine/threonine protein kinase
MNAERWNRIAEIYESVIACPPANRGALLDEACSSDGELRRELESLLQAREEAGSFLSPNELREHIRQLSGPDVAPGRTFGRYRILSLIGAGGMGEVYLARDAELDRQVALKVLPAEFTRDEGRVARFRREARAASALSHPNIVTIYDIGEAGGTRYISAEFIEGTTLRNRLALGAMDLQEALEIAVQCADALAAAHEAGIVHGDVKPENIMVRKDGVVKLVDFGLARTTGAAPEVLVNSTQTGAVFGTPRYMSPEQARGQKLDVRTDIFSLGAVLYEMTTGRAAFPGTTAAEVFAALLGSAPGASEERASILPEGLDGIVARSLEKDRDARYQTMRDFEANLRDFKKLRTSGASAMGSPRRISTRTTGWVQTRRLRQPLLIAALALVVGLGLLWLVWSTARNRPRDAPSMSVIPVTSFGGYKDFGSFSPDGERIVFSWNGGQGGFGGKQERNLYVKKIEAGEPVRLTFTQEDDIYPAWSPDGRYIAFCRMIDDRPLFRRVAVYVIPAAGGTERKLTEAGEGVSWSPDSKTLAVTGLPSESSGIFLVSLNTGRRSRVTAPGPYVDKLPVFSPDGRWIVFAHSVSPSVSELFVVQTRGGTVRQLTFDRQPTYGEAWTVDSKEIVFSSGRSGGESLWRIPVTGGTPRRLSLTLQGGFYPAISRQGDRLVYTDSFKDTNIWASDGTGFAGRLVPGRFSAPRGLIVSSRKDDSPSLSSPEDRIAFVSRRSGNEEIWVCDRDGARPVQLTAFGGPATGTPRWSPDGRWLAFDSLAAGNPNIYVMKAEGGAPRQLTSGPFGNFMPSWSPDGKRLYFKSDRNGSDQIWWVPAGGGQATQLTQAGGSEAFASPDGKLVYYTKRGWGAIWSAPVEGGPEKPVPELEHFKRIFRSWGIVKEGIYFISKEEGRSQIVRFWSFATRQVTPLLTLDKEPIWDYPDVALSSDGRRLLTARIDQEVNDLMLIENFH